MASSTLVSHDSDSSGESFVIRDINAESLAAHIDKFFTQKGYRLEGGGTPGNGVYSTGSAAMRVLFGGFAKRFKFSVSIAPVAEGVRLHLAKAMSGAGGGALGYSKMKKELAKLSEELSSLVVGLE
jgi:hypothetical protein